MLTSARDDCLAFLNENLSSWILQLATLSKGTQQRQPTSSEISNSTIQTVHDHKKIKYTIDYDNTSVVPLPATTTTPTGFYNGILSAIAGKRKRRSSSVESPADSGSNRYRTQNAKVVLYDASAQKVLETIVDDLIKAKNLIRKAKAQARMCNMRRKSSTESEDEESDFDDDTVMTQVRLRRRKTNDTGALSSSAGSSTFNVECLDKVNAILFKTQDLCTTAAYQLLRDGDCQEETGSATEELTEALIMVREEMTWIRENSFAGSLGTTPSSLSASPEQCMAKALKRDVRVSMDNIEPRMPGHLTETFLCTVESY